MKTRSTVWADGNGIGYPGGSTFMMKTNIKRIFSVKSIAAYIEGAFYLDEVLKYTKSHYKGDDMVILGHPKGLSPINIEWLESFIVAHPDLNYCVFSK